MSNVVLNKINQYIIKMVILDQKIQKKQITKLQSINLYMLQPQIPKMRYLRGKIQLVKQAKQHTVRDIGKLITIQQ